MRSCLVFPRANGGAVKLKRCHTKRWMSSTRKQSSSCGRPGFVVIDSQLLYNTLEQGCRMVNMYSRKDTSSLSWVVGSKLVSIDFTVVSAYPISGDGCSTCSPMTQRLVLPFSRE